MPDAVTGNTSMSTRIYIFWHQIRMPILNTPELPSAAGLIANSSLPLLQIAHGNNGSSRSFDHVSTPSRAIRRPPPSSDVFQSSTLFLPHPSSRLDFAISIAVIHHLSTRSRRVEAVRAMLEVLKPWKSPASTIVGAKSKAENGVKGKDEDVERIRRLAASEIGGVLLVFVWALEQKGSRRGWDQGMEQDVMVPWVMKSGGEGETNRKKRVQRLEGSEGEKAQEYGGNVGCVSGKDAMAEVEDKEEASRDKTFYRYYHLYKRGELEADVEAAGGKVLDGGWERDNWWVIAVRE